MKVRSTTALAATLAALLSLPVALAAALPSRAKYVGKTSDGGAVSLRLNGDATRVHRMRIHYTLTCDDGQSGETYTDILNPRVRKDRTFVASGKYTGSSDGSTNTFKLSGKLWTKRASGKFSLKATGTVGGTCRTGKLTWSAKRQK
jgi:hypothetical protein